MGFFYVESFEQFLDFRCVVNGHEEFAFYLFEDISQVVEVQGGEVMFVTGDIPVRRIQKEKSMLAIIFGNEFAEIQTLDIDTDEAFPCILQGGLQGEDIEPWF